MTYKMLSLFVALQIVGVSSANSSTSQAQVAIEQKSPATDPTLEKVTKMVATYFKVPKERITRETHYVNDLKASQLEVRDLALQCEGLFKIAIPDADAETLTTVGKSVDYINKRLAQPGN